MTGTSTARRTHQPSRPARAARGNGCRFSRKTPFGRHTLSGRRTTASGRSPGSRVDAGRAAFSGRLRAPMAWWPMALRSQLQGQPRSLTAFPFNPLSGNLKLGRRICEGEARGKLIVQSRSLACAADPPYQGRRNGCPQGLNREVRQAGIASPIRHCSRNC